jgi:hypothetical protein
MDNQKFNSLKEFYPYYLSEHKNAVSRTLHFIGTAAVLFFLIAGISTEHWIVFACIPLVGYGFAWIGHAVFEKNKPATFKYPFYSLASDFIMFWELLTGKIPFKGN